MENLKKGIIVATVFMVIIFISGCYKDKTILTKATPEITREVSFANDIIPIFNSSCNSSSCHSSGGKPPYLNDTKAYNSLINGGYVNTDLPESSELYLWMTGERGSPMPTSGINKDYNALILAWIKQGAQNK